jgi:hypothetical protein
MKVIYTPPKGTLGILIVTPSDECPTTAPRLNSTQALRSRRVSSASKSLGMLGSRLRPPRLWSWFCGSTRNPDGFVVNHRKPRRLGAASTPIPLMTWPPRCPGSTLVSRLNQEIVPDFVLLFLPPCSTHMISFGHRVHQAEPTCLHSSKATQAKTFRTRSSPAPTQIKLQPAPAILGQESVHTTLSITHHSQ